MFEIRVKHEMPAYQASPEKCLGPQELQNVFWIGKVDLYITLG